VSGWLDPYTEAVGTLLTGLRVPRKALIGPWGHQMPNLPAPMNLDWAHEEVRWWQQWLQSLDTGIMDEPMFRAFMPYQTLSEVYPAEIPGRWFAESSWPPADRQLLELHLDKDTLTPKAPESHLSITLVGDKVVGQCKPHWMPSLPDDQQADDAKSLVFDSRALDADTEIFGQPVARVRVSANVPVAKLVVRLTEVMPDGKSWLVSYGILNLTHRDSHEHPTPLTPGRFYDVEVPLYMVAHRFKKGSRIRAAISETMWPMVWPSPAIATLTIDSGNSSLIVPVRKAPAQEAAFSIPVKRVGGSSSYLRAGNRNGTEVTFESPLERTAIPDIDTVMETYSSERLMLRDEEPNSCFWSQENTTSWKRHDWDCTVGAAFELQSSAEEFSLKEVLWAKKGDREIFRREQSSTIKRDLL
jgi:putative CocE/NonD family hydrolase